MPTVTPVSILCKDCSHCQVSDKQRKPKKKKLTAEKRGDDFKMLALSLSISLLFPLQLSFLFNHGSSNLVNERRYVVVVISYVVVNEIL